MALIKGVQCDYCNKTVFTTTVKMKDSELVDQLQKDTWKRMTTGLWKCERCCKQTKVTKGSKKICL